MTSPRRPTRLPVAGVAAIKLGLLVAAGVYLASALLYVLPAIPLKAAAGDFLSVVIGKIFSQNWNLFAPEPIDATDVILARCDAGEPATESGWNDISTRFFRSAQAHRFSGYERLSRPQQVAARRYISGDSLTDALRTSCRKGDASDCLEFDSSLTSLRDEMAPLLARIGSAFCREAFPSSRPGQVALRYRRIGAVPWSQRGVGRPDIVDFDLGVYPVDMTVAL